MIRKKITDSFYEADIEIIVNCTALDVEKVVMDEFGFRVDQRDCDATMLKVGNHTKLKRIIYINEFDWSIPKQGLLFHEVIHVTCDVLGDLGMKCTSDSEEAYAYYGQMIYMACLGALKELRE